ncbi:hypothetical protein DASB73_007920 [Starmerella bacillaris]|uniref:Uncharacterized protein n=1 Tax=Starmerella bacillaris TaxID=1247836 RepID=A0AAV5RH20_STABA|nr:hypothetical protein DASB73_007920 [Starmerella bacillaris]
MYTAWLYPSTHWPKTCAASRNMLLAADLSRGEIKTALLYDSSAGPSIKASSNKDRNPPPH